MVNFDVQFNKDRVKEVEKELENKKPTAAQLEMYANYILYGKDESGSSPVDRGEIEIDSKFKSYRRRQTESLDELMESPTFNEQTLQPLKRSIYKNPKPELDKSLPELEPILASIDYYEKEKAELESEPQTQENKTKIWKLKHLIIELRREQYAVQEEVKGPIKPLKLTPPEPEFNFDFLDLDVKPLGLKIGDLKRFVDPRNDKSDFSLPCGDGIDLENPLHIYAILESWELLYEKALDDPYHNAKYLLETVDWYIEQAHLDPSRLDIIRMKKFKASNSQIRTYLNSHYGYKYNENYISTIYTKEICKKIADAVTLHKNSWQARNDPSQWKKCSCCGEWKLKDARNFVRKKTSVDGFNSRCKECSKKIKEGKL